MMSAFEKLGFYDYMIAAIMNPAISRYKKQIRRLCNSGNEVGLHGGKNHALWQKYAHTWSYNKIKDEVEWGLKQIREIVPNVEIASFSSPGWNSPQCLPDILNAEGIKYYADLKNWGGVA